MVDAVSGSAAAQNAQNISRVQNSKNVSEKSDTAVKSGSPVDEVRISEKATALAAEEAIIRQTATDVGAALSENTGETLANGSSALDKLL